MKKSFHARMRSITSLLMALPLGALAQEPANSGAHQAGAPPYVAPQPGEGLKVRIGSKGLESVKYDGKELLIAGYGMVELFNHPKLFKADGTSDAAASQPDSVTREGDTITQVFPWGKISTTYGLKDTRLTMKVVVENSSPDELRASLRLLGIKFPATPDASVVDVGMWGNGGIGKMGLSPLGVNAKSSPPVIATKSPIAAMDYCIDDSEGIGSISIPFALDGKAALQFPVAASVGDIPAGGKSEATFSLRFAPATPGPITFACARDVLECFAKKHPFTLKWDDRRPIGQIMLAWTGVTGEALKTNPSRWMVANGTKQTVDTTTPEGREEFRALVLRWADVCIKTLKEAGAQGMVTWDPEGQRIGHTFYGESHMTGELAPEMVEEVEVEVIEGGKPKMVKMPLIDAYFRKFLDAGLRTGVCLRPQSVSINPAGFPIQKELAGEEAYQNLKTDIEYARKHWGCTFFYIDSTFDPITKGSMDPEILTRLNREFPDILMMPENQTTLYYSCSAPLDGTAHHGVFRTHPKIRELWPEAFTLLMGAGTQVLGEKSSTPEVKAQRRALLLDGIKHGDIPMVPGWYLPEGTKEVMAIYQEAAEAKAAGK
jgi:hypothetical protein